MIKAITVMLMLASVAAASQYYALHHARRVTGETVWDGLAAYYGLDGDAYDEVTGTTGDWLGGVVQTNEVPFAGSGSAASLDGGSASYVNTVNSNLLNGVDEATIAAWVRTTTTVGASGIAVARGAVYQVLAANDVSPRTGYDTYVKSATGAIAVQTGNGIRTSAEWQHVAAVTYIQGTVRGCIIYVNGLPVASNTINNITALVQDDVFRIGWDDIQSGRKHRGQIDEVGIWRRALTGSEMHRIYSENLIYRKP
jgi:hypothetical protein